MKTITLIFTASFLFFSTHVFSQIDLLNKVKNNALKKVENKIEKKADEALDNALNKADDKLFKDKDKDKNKNNNNNNSGNDSTGNGNASNQGSGNTSGNGGNNSGGTGGYNPFNNLMGGKTIPTSENYDFNTYMEIETENFNEDNESAGRYVQKLYTNTNNFNCAMLGSNPEEQSGEALMIMDYTNKAFLIVSYNNADKTGIVMPFNDTIIVEQNTQETKVEDFSQYNPLYRKTGNSKSILGYKCYEYTASTTEYEHIVWVTTEYKMEQSQSFTRTQGFSQIFAYGYFPGGFTMEMYHKNIADKTSTHMLVKDIKASANNSFKLSGYQLMSMGGQ